MATTLVAKEAKWLRLLLCDLGEESKEATLVAKEATWLRLLLCDLGEESKEVTLVAEEATWLRLLLCDLGEESKEATVIYCDNQSIIALTQNPKFHSRSKHIELQFHFIQEKVANNEVQFTYYPTENMIANIKVQFTYYPTEIMIANIFNMSIPSKKHEDFTPDCGVAPNSGETKDEK
jgi:hypothetical protein